jgi:lipopolysaccharide biosynthesis glycosyltransferase
VLPRLRDLGLPDARRYFNSGVMVMDLRRLRDDGRVVQVADLIRSASVPMPWADQDPLNAVLHGERLDLHPRWNVMTPVFDLPAPMLPWTVEEIEEAKAEPAVVHFIGEYKPWHYRCRHPYREAWFEQLAGTPWAGRPVEGRTLEHILLRPLPPRWQPKTEAWLQRLAARGRRTILRRGPL